jgi:glycerol-3-phosphate dehydrogenase (NAD(P)+)
VRLWVRRAEHLETVRRDGENRRYLPGVPVPPGLAMTADIAEAVRGADVVVFAVPSQRLRAIARAAAPHVRRDALLVSAVKGIEEDSLRRMSEVLAEEIGGADGERIAALAGPSHAEEVARGAPTVVVAASRAAAGAERVRALFGTDAFRIYTNGDLVGVELAVSLKNVIAIAAGICDGLGFGDNMRGALLSRGLAEITRLGVAMGARERTFWGLAGVGDLVTTSTSRHSRNRRVGEEIGRGRGLAEVLDELVMVAEGVPTTRSAARLAAIHGVEMPITGEVHAILFERKDPRQALSALMRRLPKEEGA